MSVIAKLNFFRGMFKSVVAALNESLDITLHLQPLISHFKVSHIMILPFQFGLPFKFQTLEATEFTDIRVLFPPLLHTICLVYSTSKYYNSSARIIVLLMVSTRRPKILVKYFCFQETCNLLIDMARGYLDPSSIFQIEVSNISIKILTNKN